MNDKFAQSILFGGLICLAGNATVVWHSLKTEDNHKPNVILIKIYQGQVIKIVLMGILFSAVLILFEGLNYVVLLSVFFFSQLFFSFAPLASNKSKQTKT